MDISYKLTTMVGVHSKRILYIIFWTTDCCRVKKEQGDHPIYFGRSLNFYSVKPPLLSCNGQVLEFAFTFLETAFAQTFP